MTSLKTDAEVSAQAYAVWESVWFEPMKKKRIADCDGDEGLAYEKLRTAWNSPLTQGQIAFAKQQYETSAAAAVASTGDAKLSEADAMPVDAADQKPAAKPKVTKKAAAKKTDASSTASATTATSTVAIERTNIGLFNASKSQPAKEATTALTIDNIAAYCAEPKRARFMLAALVANGIVNNEKKEKKVSAALVQRYKNRGCADGSDPWFYPSEKKIVKKKDANGAESEVETDVDFNVAADRMKEFENVFEARKTEAIGAKTLKEYFGGDAKKVEAAEFSLVLRVRSNLFAAMKFTDIMPVRIENENAAQLFVMPFYVGESTEHVISLKHNLATKLFPLHVMRAFVRLQFSDEKDWANGRAPQGGDDSEECGKTPISLVDCATLGKFVVRDAKLDTEKLLEAYEAADSAGVYEWFATTLPAACDPSKGGNLTPADFALTKIDENVALLASDPPKKTRAPAKSKAKGDKANGTAGGAAADGAPSTTPASTIKKFTAAKQPPTKKHAETKIAMSTALGTLTMGDPLLVAALADQVGRTTLDAELDEVSPAKTKDDIRSLVLPSTEGKPVGQAKNSKAAAAAIGTDGDGENGDNNNAGDDEVREEVPAAARSRYLSHCAQLPKLSARIFMGTDLIAAEKNAMAIGGAADSDVSAVPLSGTKSEAQARVNDDLSRVLDLGRALPRRAVIDSKSLLALVDRLEARHPEAVVDLIMAQLRVTCVDICVFRGAVARRDLNLNSENPSDFFASERTLNYLANMIRLRRLLHDLKMNYNKPDKWPATVKRVRDQASKVRDVTHF